MGYSIVSNLTLKILSAGIISKIISVNGFYYVPFNISGFDHCKENLMLALSKREFIYEVNNEITEPISHANLIDILLEDWSNICKLKELQAEAYRYEITKLKIFIHENNVSFVGVLTILLTIYGNLVRYFYAIISNAIL